MVRIKYDKKCKILSIRLRNNPSVDSEMQGNVVIDYDGKGRVVNVEIMSINLDEFKKINNHYSTIFTRKKQTTLSRQIHRT